MNPCDELLVLIQVACSSLTLDLFYAFWCVDDNSMIVGSTAYHTAAVGRPCF
jgi:hypothetical protein